MSICPEGYYWNGKRCQKKIVIKEQGIYGKGFLSEPRSEQEAKIRKESRIEGSVEAEKQMAALNAFSHNKGSAHKDMEYAKKMGMDKRLKSGKEHNCPEGYEWVSSHSRRTGYRVNGYCRKVK
jgi:hypothetical protein